jgi:hypothetical protein
MQRRLDAMPFVLLGGSSYAARRGSIGNREIKDNSVRSTNVRNGELRGKDPRRNTLGGRVIDERRLGAVPPAARAATAESAGDTSTLGGLGPDAFKLRCRRGPASMRASA